MLSRLLLGITVFALCLPVLASDANTAGNESPTQAKPVQATNRQRVAEYTDWYLNTPYYPLWGPGAMNRLGYSDDSRFDGDHKVAKQP